MADSVLVLERGKIADYGSLDNIMQNPGSYTKLLLEAAYN
jgi:ABC-type microcin C transport system duplicated ATPase subunit YejF